MTRDYRFRPDAMPRRCILQRQTPEGPKDRAGIVIDLTKDARLRVTVVEWLKMAGLVMRLTLASARQARKEKSS